MEISLQTRTFVGNASLVPKQQQRVYYDTYTYVIALDNVPQEHLNNVIFHGLINVSKLMLQRDDIESPQLAECTNN